MLTSLLHLYRVKRVSLENNFVRQSRSLHHSRWYSGTSQISVSFLLLSLRLFYRLVFGQSRKKILDKKWLGVLSSTGEVPRSSSIPVFHSPASCTDERNFGHPSWLVTRFDGSDALFHR